MPLSCEQAANSPAFPVFRYKELLKKMDETDDSGVIYPESDGEPMGETQIHVIAIIHLYLALEHFFRTRPDVYTVADMLMYYEKGNPKAFKVPDVMVVKGVEKHMRRIFRVWEEKAGPCVIFEITSKSTADGDISKTGLYASLGVREYFLFDPLEEYLESSFQGFRLDGIMYSPIAPEKDGSFFSRELGLFLKREGHLLRAVDPETGRAVPSFNEAIYMAGEEAQRADKAERRAEEEARRAEEEARRAEEEARHAEEETQRAEEEARKSARMAAKLREMGIDPDLV
ncbi:MAG: Uma2 family endonuclease [Desulfococcaceae bacterium]